MVGNPNDDPEPDLGHPNFGRGVRQLDFKYRQREKNYLFIYHNLFLGSHTSSPFSHQRSAKFCILQNLSEVSLLLSISIC